VEKTVNAVQTVNAQRDAHAANVDQSAIVKINQSNVNVVITALAQPLDQTVDAQKLKNYHQLVSAVVANAHQANALAKRSAHVEKTVNAMTVTAQKDANVVNVDQFVTVKTNQFHANVDQTVNALHKRTVDA